MSNRETTDSGSADQPLDLAQVVDEIEAEAARKRESGEYPASLERELDALFEDLVPERLNEHDFEAVLDRAERASLIDLHAPIEDERRVYAQVKKGVQKLVLWYMDYVVRQLATFAANTTRAVRLLGNRVEGVEERQEALVRRLPDAGGDLDLLARALQPELPDVTSVGDRLAGISGRVLHAEAGDGHLVTRLRERGLDAYGADPGVSDETLDLRRGAALDHLHLVAEGALGGAVLTGVVDRLAAPSKLALLEAAARALAPEGRLVIVAATPESWDEAVPTVVRDLSQGRPFHAETWRAVLERMGAWKAVDIGAEGSRHILVTATRSS